MKPFLTSSLAAVAGALMLAGCAVAPVEGPYGYGYGRPYYYEPGPAYYDAWPGYYGYYGAPTISFGFGGERDRHWGGGSWRHESLTFPRGRTMPRGSRAAHTSLSRSHASTSSRARTGRIGVTWRDSDKS
jgi:hypothetical protein